MYALLPLLLIFFSFVVIVFVIVKKFPQLTLLDVESIPEVKEEKKKNEFLKKRAEKKNQETKEKQKEKIEPILQMSKNIQSSFRKFVGQIEKRVFQDTFRRVRQQKIEQGISPQDEIQTLLKDAMFAYEQENFESAEKKYIEVIRLDPKEVLAYSGLADVYVALKQTKEAEETYKFVHHLDPNNEHVLVSLADLAEAQGNITAAIGYYEKAVILNDSVSSRFAKFANLLQGEKQYHAALESMKQALELEPQNPKYLDNIIELAIMVGNKALAEEQYKKLRLVNPDNQKLPVLKEKIQDLEENS